MLISQLRFLLGRQQRFIRWMTVWAPLLLWKAAGGPLGHGSRRGLGFAALSCAASAITRLERLKGKRSSPCSSSSTSSCHRMCCHLFSAHSQEPPRKARSSPVWAPVGLWLDCAGYPVSANQSAHHSQTLPVMSYNPYPFGANEPTGARRRYPSSPVLRFHGALWKSNELDTYICTVSHYHPKGRKANVHIRTNFVLPLPWVEDSICSHSHAMWTR